MGVEKLLVQGGTFQNIGTPSSSQAPTCPELPASPRQGPQVTPRERRRRVHPPHQGPVQETPEQLWGHSPPSWGAGPHHWGLRPDYGHAACPGAPRRPRPTGPITLQCQDTPRMGGPPAVPRSCSLPSPGPLLLGAWAEAGPGEEAFLCRAVLSPSAILSVSQVVSVLPRLPGCQHILEGSEDVLVKCGPPRLSHRTTPWWLPWQLWGPVGVAMRVESAKVCPGSCLLCLLSLSFK